VGLSKKMTGLREGVFTPASKAALNTVTLTKILDLVWFLDKLKCENLLSSDVCLFRVDAAITSSTTVLQEFFKVF
jgi:hypothetical protein